VTAAEICQTLGISPATFYRYVALNTFAKKWDKAGQLTSVQQ
jgi:predicted DNA-binding transcriptional regulator AlpA